MDRNIAVEAHFGVVAAVLDFAVGNVAVDMDLVLAYFFVYPYWAIGVEDVVIRVPHDFYKGSLINLLVSLCFRIAGQYLSLERPAIS
jgi:hypothetical protein